MLSYLGDRAGQLQRALDLNLKEACMMVDPVSNGLSEVKASAFTVEQ